MKRQMKYGNVTVNVRWGERSPLKESISLLSRIGASKIWLSEYDIHPSRGRRRIAEVGSRVRDAGLDVVLYFVDHEVGRNSPDSLPFKIEAARALGAKAICLKCPSDEAVARTLGENDPYGYHKDDVHIEEYFMADWDDARQRKANREYHRKARRCAVSLSERIGTTGTYGTTGTGTSLGCPGCLADPR